MSISSVKLVVYSIAKRPGERVRVAKRTEIKKKYNAKYIRVINLTGVEMSQAVENGHTVNWHGCKLLISDLFFKFWNNRNGCAGRAECLIAYKQKWSAIFSK